MSITSIPTQTEDAGQLGKSKTDGAGVYDADTKVKAAQWNQVVLRVIAAISELGLSDRSAAGVVRDTDFSGTFAGRLFRSAARTYNAIKDNLSPGAGPTVTDDGSAGYSLGSWWINTGSVGAYVCTDPKPGDARWAKVPDSKNPTIGDAAGTTTITGLDTSITAGNDVTISAADDVLISSTDDTTITAGDALALSGHTAGLTASTGDATVTAAGAINLAPTTNTNAGNKKITAQADPTAATDGANARYADQPTTRAISGTTGTLGAADIGAVLKLSNAGSITFTTANLTSSLRSGGSIFVTVILTGGGTLTIADGSGCTHSGSPSGTSCVLWSDDGVTWYVR